jgi:hypothetical protein
MPERHIVWHESSLITKEAAGLRMCDLSVVKILVQ